MASVHPPVVLGPQQASFVTSSNLIVKMLLAGEYPLAPPFHWQTIDVRDIARAHVTVLEAEKSHGRYLVSNPPPGVWTQQIAVYLKKHFPLYSKNKNEKTLILIKEVVVYVCTHI